MSDQIITQMKVEGQPAFPTNITENDNSTESSTVDKTNETNQTGSSDQDKKTDADKTGSENNFADHPRWKERESDWTKRFNEQEERHTGELAKFREDIDKRFSTKTADASTEVPSWFGGDENQWSSFQQWNQDLITKAKQEARDETLKEFETRSTSEQRAVDDATKFFNDEVGAIEIDKKINPQGLKVDRNKLLKSALDFDLVDSKGRWNYRAAWRFLQNGQSKSDGTKDRKDIASATTSERGGDSKPPAFMTSSDFKNPTNRPW